MRRGASALSAVRTFDDILTLLKKPFDVERAHGYRNGSVFGGFGAYVAKWALEARSCAPHAEAAQAMDEVRALFGDYEVLSPKDRQARMTCALQVLERATRPAGSAMEPSVLRLGPPSPLRSAVAAAPPRVEAPPAAARKPAAPPPPSKAAAPEREVYVAVPDEEREGTDVPMARVEAATVTVHNPKELQKSPAYARGVGSRTARLLERLNLLTIEDMLWHLPRKHEDRRNMVKIRDLEPGEMVTVCGQISSVSFFQPPRKPKMSIMKVTLSDGTGHVEMVYFNRPYLRSALKKGMKLLVSGKPERPKKGPATKLQMNGPEYEELTGEDDTVHVGRIVPIYGLTESLTQRLMRKVMKQVVDDHAQRLPEILPRTVRSAQGMMPRPEAIRQCHFPETPEHREQALESLIFEELFVMQVGLALRRRETERVPREGRYTLDLEAAEQFAVQLPFAPTGAQQRVMRELRDDLLSPVPMSRLVQGDVGSGKTVVAAFAAWCACRSGFQAAIMAPTEILAEQLSRKIQDLIGDTYNVCLLTGSMTTGQRDRALEGLALGEIHVAVGTHALIQEDVRFHKLAMAIIDEQHKFGVVQRSTLRNKGYNPDVLVMSATPIPRTLSLTLYGDLEVSIIDELPAGRSPIKSYWRQSDRLDAVYEFAEKQIGEGRQVYVVCPLVEESEKLESVSSATAEAQRVAERFPHRRVGLLHGRMKSDEKDAVMDRFRSRDFDVLVSTTVVEVGVDVPNATVMIIQNADRFGLAQLHQLRGRVGRGQHQSYCVFLADPQSEEGVERMRVISGTTDGFEIAEHDLKFRGPGDFIGARQSGLPDLRVADLVRDKAVLERARHAARELVTRDAFLASLECQQLKDEVLRCFRGQLVSMLS